VVYCTLVTDGRTKATVKEIGCYADREDDPDLPVFGPPGADPRFCMLNFCLPHVSRYQRFSDATFWNLIRLIWSDRIKWTGVVDHPDIILLFGSDASGSGHICRSREPERYVRFQKSVTTWNVFANGGIFNWDDLCWIRIEKIERQNEADYITLIGLICACSFCQSKYGSSDHT